MIKQYLIILIALIFSTLSAQKVSFPDAAFKSIVLQSNSNNTIARNLADDYFAIDANSNGEIEIEEALQVAHLQIENSTISSLTGIENFTNLLSLNCSNNLISNLNVDSLTKLTDLNCNNNILNMLNLKGATQLQNLNCQSNQLASLDVSNLSNLQKIDCSDNKLKSINLTNLTNLESLICNSNQISSFDLADLTNLITLECTSNTLTSIDFSKITNIESLNCSFNKISSLDITTLIDLTTLDCSNNQLLTLKVDGLSRLSTLNCSYNLLTNMTINTLSSIVFLYCNNNDLQSLVVKGLMNLKVLNVSTNQIVSLDINGLTTLQNLYCSNNKLFELDATNQTGFQSLDISNNVLTNLYIKNGSNESYGFLLISGNPALNYICADESEIDYVQEQISNNSYTNCFVNSYCSFAPGGNFYTVEGHSKLDSNNTGCDVMDTNFPNLKLSINDGTNTSTRITDTSGYYSYGVKDGTYTILPVLENPTYYTISPPAATVTFPDATSPFLANFCINPNGNHSDLEISLLPLNDSTNNLDSKYVLVYKNKGTLTSSGVINLTFDANALNLVSANPTISSEGLGILTWNFTNLKPQEARTVAITLKVKPTVNAGYTLRYNATISKATDQTPEDNSVDLNQNVVDILNSNDKICLEGNVISPTKIGDYLHYMIRFENSGSSIARNIVIKDLIDVSKFDIKTLVPLVGSHPFTTTITNDTIVEFIFATINFPFEMGSNTGYLAFKIKTVPELLIGNEITNSATIYFDYNEPLATNNAITNIQVLQVPDYILSDSYLLYPNPAAHTLNIAQKNEIGINSISIFNTMGQLVETYIKQDRNDITSIAVSQLKKGIYFIRINSEKGNATYKFIKD